MNKSADVKRYALAIWALLVIFMLGAETEDIQTGLILAAASYAQMIAIALIWRKIENK